MHKRLDFVDQFDYVVGTWFMHCHLEIHMSWGLSVVFIVKNGQGALETLPHPPADLPRC